MIRKTCFSPLLTAHIRTLSSVPSKKPTRKLAPVTARDAHGRKPLREIVLGLAVMQAMRIKFLAQNSDQIIKSSEVILGKWLTHLIVKYTFFFHFGGGEHTNELSKKVSRLAVQNIGSIFDYAAEAEEAGHRLTMKDLIRALVRKIKCKITGRPEPDDVPPPPSMRGMTAISKDRNIVYSIDPNKLDETMTLNLFCIGHAKLMVRKVGVGFSAIKLTGLCEPMLLARVSALMLVLRQAWVGFFNPNPPPLEECRVVVGFALDDRFASTDAVRKGLQEHMTRQGKPQMIAEEVDAIMKVLDPTGSGKIDYLRYISVVTSALLDSDSKISQVLKPFMDSNPSLTEQELSMWKDLEHRVGIIMAMAVELGVKVTVDAEQSYYQMAIDYLVRANQAKYNKTEAVIYNTYQCYLTFTPQRLKNDLARAADEGWEWAGKMVRGAYMNAEHETAERNNYKTPIWKGVSPQESLAMTHKCYDDAANLILDLIAAKPDGKIGVLFGTHNPSSVQLIADRLADIGPTNSTVACAQLLGMADHLTVGLARAGVSVFKYVPYGPVEETILYLGRRAKENNDVLSGARPEEYQLLKEEFLRRLKGGRRDK